MLYFIFDPLPWFRPLKSQRTPWFVLFISVTLVFSLCRSFTVPKVFWRKTGDVCFVHCSHWKMRKPFLTCLVLVRLSARPSRSIDFGHVSETDWLKAKYWGCRNSEGFWRIVPEFVQKKKNTQKQTLKSSVVLWIIFLLSIFTFFTEMLFVMRFLMCWWKAGKTIYMYM